MALDHYGVLLGTLAGHHRDTPDDQGRWFHVHLAVDAYSCAIDVDSKQSLTGVQWRLLHVTAEQLAPVPGLGDGFHELPRTLITGALDLIRHPVLAGAGGWTAGSHLEASTALESILAIGRRALVWGEPFETGLGVHNVHQNQGDPPGGRWWDENGMWQDGAVMTMREDGTLDVFISKFSTQASETDNYGHPLR